MVGSCGRSRRPRDLLPRRVYDFWTIRREGNCLIMTVWNKTLSSAEGRSPRHPSSHPLTPTCFAPRWRASTTSGCGRSAWPRCKPRWFSSRWISWSVSRTSKASSAASRRTWSTRRTAAAAASGSSITSPARCTLWLAYMNDQLYSSRNGGLASLNFPHESLAEHLYGYAPGWTATMEYKPGRRTAAPDPARFLPGRRRARHGRRSTDDRRPHARLVQTGPWPEPRGRRRALVAHDAHRGDSRVKRRWRSTPAR